MLKRFVKGATVVVVNLVVLAVLLGLIELGFRLAYKEPANALASDNSRPTIQWAQFAPFVMFRDPHYPGGGRRWDDVFHDQIIIAKMDNNQLGFAMREEVDFVTVRPKAENERVIVLSGASALWGVGATSIDTNIAGRLQAILNERQTRYRYTVLNLAMGGWVSTQELIALALYGRNLQPDWLLTMDGYADVAVACAHSQGAGHPMYYGIMDAYINAYTFGQIHPVFYRGWLENELIKHSVAYRKLTGLDPVTVDVQLDARDPLLGRSVIRSTTWTDVERQLELYVQTEAEMIDLLPRAKVLLSAHPISQEFEMTFGRIYQTRGTAAAPAAIAELKQRLDDIAAAARGEQCGLDRWDDARNWFMPSSALRLEALADQYRSVGREVHYVNPNVLFPNLAVYRRDYFIDPPHLNEAGMDAFARLYAEIILASDLPDQFTPPQWAGKPLPEPPVDGPDEVQVVEASYGLNCQGAQVPAPARNRVEARNASDAAGTACRHKHGTCEFAVDLRQLGDPAQACAKDFSIQWRCGAQPAIHRAYLPAEANGKTVSLHCPAE
jgi:hypothetical protein